MAQGGTRIVVGRDHFRLWDITYVTNAADAHMLAAENLVASKTAAGEVFFIQNNEPIPFRDFCLAVWAFFGHVPEYDIHVPVFVALVAGFIVDLVAWLTGFHSSLSYGAVKEYCTMRYANGRKAQQILGYEARVGLDDAVRISCEVRSCVPAPTDACILEFNQSNGQNYARRIGVTPPKPPV
jgi:sterol-4alpha-carboxylate 3-dehydrogenase (decarboxylating)